MPNTCFFNFPIYATVLTPLCFPAKLSFLCIYNSPSIPVIFPISLSFFSRQTFLFPLLLSSIKLSNGLLYNFRHIVTWNIVLVLQLLRLLLKSVKYAVLKVMDIILEHSLAGRVQLFSGLCLLFQDYWTYFWFRRCHLAATTEHRKCRNKYSTCVPNRNGKWFCKKCRFDRCNKLGMSSASKLLSIYTQKLIFVGSLVKNKIE